MQMWTASVADDVWIAKKKMFVFFLWFAELLECGVKVTREVSFTYMLIYFVGYERINHCTLFEILLSEKHFDFFFFFFHKNKKKMKCCQWGAVISNTDQLVSEIKITLERWKTTEIENKPALMQRLCYVTFKNLERRLLDKTLHTRSWKLCCVMINGGSQIPVCLWWWWYRGSPSKHLQKKPRPFLSLW